MVTPPQVFFAGRYSYRKPSVLIVGLAFLAVATGVLSVIISAKLRATWTWEAIPGILFSGIPLLMLFASLWVLRLWIRAGFNSIEISSEGVTYNKSFDSWDKIAWIAGHSQEHGRVGLFYQRRGFLTLDRHLWVDQNPTIAEYEDLMDAISDGIGEKHPHVIVG